MKPYRFVLTTRKRFLSFPINGTQSSTNPIMCMPTEEDGGELNNQSEKEAGEEEQNVEEEERQVGEKTEESL